MVFFNYATMQMAAKIVYYGPGLCGKTTNLHCIYGKTSPQSRGEMVSLETETDRTLFFDLLPIDVGVIGGFKTRLQLYTIPGQVFYNTTRKLVLKGVDGIVFVADSQKRMVDANVESFKNLRENLSEIDLDLDKLPLVIQLNKRDLPNVADTKTLLDALDPEGTYEYVEASAVTGQGVFETLKLISKLTLRTLRKRMSGEEPKSTLSVRSSSTPGPATPVSTPDSRPARLRPADPAKPSAPLIPAIHPASTRPQSPVAAASALSHSSELQVAEVEVPRTAGEEPLFEDTDSGQLASVGSDLIATAPIASAPVPMKSDAENERPLKKSSRGLDLAPVAVPLPEPASTAKVATPPIKTVRVRSTVDIMAELEALRKRATQPTERPKKKASAPPTTFEKTLQLPVKQDSLTRARTAEVSVLLRDASGAALSTVSQSVEIESEGDGPGSVILTLNMGAKPVVD